MTPGRMDSHGGSRERREPGMPVPESGGMAHDAADAESSGDSGSSTAVDAYGCVDWYDFDADAARRRERAHRKV